ncbi:MAG: hypothetical protein ACFBWO_07230 [Paracoccaceae bacterium]
MLKLGIAAALVAGLAASGAQAVTFVENDNAPNFTSSFNTAPFLGTFDGSEFIVQGRVSTGTDSFLFDSTVPFDVNITSIATPSREVDVTLLEPDGTISSLGSASASTSVPVTVASGLAAGMGYGLQVASMGGSGNFRYEFTLLEGDDNGTVIPLPPAAALLLVGIAGIGLASRRNAA